MTDRNINCAKCNIYLGTIRDAKLKKNMAHLCSDCNTAYQVVETAYKCSNSDSKGPVDDLFGGKGGIWDDTFNDIFGNIKK